MASKLQSFGPEALVLFSGDAFNPSLLSTITQVCRPRGNCRSAPQMAAPQRWRGRASEIGKQRWCTAC